VDAPDLSAIVLCYRAGDSILAVVDPLCEQLQAAAVQFELVLVANYDRDREDPTPSTAARFAQSHENVRVLSQPKQGAMGWDMRSGLDAAGGRYMIVIDGDAQNPIEDVLRMYREMRRTGAAVMKGRRTSRFDGTYRRVVSWFYNALFLLLFRTRGLWDINGKPKGLTRAAFERMELSSDDWFIDAEIVLEARRAGLAVIEMPVVFNRNEERASLVRASAIVEFIRNMFRARLRMR
jgi:glycosyltransferase involved in cell wall biosynthesis